MIRDSIGASRSEPTRWSCHGFTSIVLASLAVRAVALAAIWRAPLSSDGHDYVTMAERLLNGDHFVPYWPPGLPLFLVPFVAMSHSQTTYRAAMLIFWLLACWGFYRLARVTHTEKQGLLILGFFSLFPAAIHLSLDPLTQLPMAAMLLIALSATLRDSLSASLKESLLLGVALGYMVLVRPSSALLLVLAAFPAWKLRRIWPCACALAVALTVVASWLWWSHRASGAWVLNTANAHNFWNGNNPWTPNYRTWYFGSHAKLGSPEINVLPGFRDELHRISLESPLTQQLMFQHLAEDYIRNHPWVFLLRTANRMRCFWGFDIFTSQAISGQFPRVHWLLLAAESSMYMLLLGSAVFWLAGAPRELWSRWDVRVLLGSSILYGIPYWISMSHPTYHFPVILPVVLAGSIAAQDKFRVGASHRSGWLGLAGLTSIQLEWVWQMLAAHAG